ncbi:hypothetical protein MMC31_006710 [Peltigera leucophlebia]|nr:hypothetical protein [Peltigera leucophlebia]
MPSALAIELLGFCLLGSIYIFFFTARRGRRLPPGPPTLPIIGNLHQVPKSGAHFQFTKWAREYGPIVSLKLGPATAIVITDRSIAKAMLDKKSAIYSDRPSSYVSHDLITRGDHLLVMKQGEKWRLFRKLVHQQLLESRCEREHITLQNAEAVQMLNDFMVDPNGLMGHPKRFSNSIIMSVLFGIRSDTPETRHSIELYELMEGWSNVMETGATPPVDIFPIFKWIPQRFFNNWIARSRSVGTAMDKLYGRLVSHVIQRRLKAGSQGSFLDDILDQQEKLQLNRNELNFLCGVLIEGGSDTSSSMILAFIHAMIKFPHVQIKAQQEIDSVVGEDRSPLWSDYAKLPYINQVVKETMRWRPVTPLAFPHAASADDTINDMHIPKGSTIILNVWGLHHDPIRFPSPDVFDPDRYTGYTLLASECAASADVEKRDHYGYGAGRRLCPGIHMAERGLFLAMSKLLWAFSFAEKLDGQGRLIPIDVDAATGYSEGLLHCPKPFDCEIKPRSEARQETILKEYAQAEKNTFSQYETL